MKIFYLFLDIDGVLTNFRCSISQGKDRSGMMEYFDPIAIQFLNSLHRENTMKVVITSTWRKKYWGNSPSLLRTAGFIGDFADPCFTKDMASNGMNRGDEIQLWLTENEKTNANIIILDDDSDMGHLEDSLVLTDGMNGITAENMIKIQEMIENFDG